MFLEKRIHDIDHLGHVLWNVVETNMAGTGNLVELFFRGSTRWYRARSQPRTRRYRRKVAPACQHSARQGSGPLFRRYPQEFHW